MRVFDVHLRIYLVIKKVLLYVSTVPLSSWLEKKRIIRNRFYETGDRDVYAIFSKSSTIAQRVDGSYKYTLLRGCLSWRQRCYLERCYVL